MKNKKNATETRALITAAPELLSALSWITRCAYAKGPVGTKMYFISDKAMNAAKKAVAKAT